MRDIKSYIKIENEVKQEQEFLTFGVKHSRLPVAVVRHTALRPKNYYTCLQGRYEHKKEKKKLPYSQLRKENSAKKFIKKEQK